MNTLFTFNAPPRGIATQFLRTTWLLSADRRLDLQGQSLSIRRISADECRSLVEQARKRNVFARHSWEKNFYVERIRQLEEKTIIDIQIPGEIDSVLPEAKAQADQAERVIFISATLGLKRQRIRQLLAISEHRRHGFDIAISPGFKYLRSSERQEARPRGISITDAFIRRFSRCGFPQVISAAAANTDIGRRITQSLSWLFESRQEVSARAAAVKTAIALESLLIASDSENLRASLAERVAFLLAKESDRRHRIAQTVKLFYDLRSAIVHGGRRKVAISDAVIDGMDRIVVLLLLTIAHNSGDWVSFDQLKEAVEEMKWGGSLKDFKRPFPSSHLSRALRLFEERAKGTRGQAQKSR